MELRPSKLKALRQSLVPGQVYRRADLARLSSNVDRHLAELLAGGQLRKLSAGLYAAPKESAFGESLPDEHSLLRAFLKDDRFVVYSHSLFNALELGTTQLYNRRVVFNRKRVGDLNVGGRIYSFRRWREAPKELTVEFLVVELLNHLNDLAENRDQVLERLREKLPTFDTRRLKYAAQHYGTVSTRNRLDELTQTDQSNKSA